MTKFINRLTGSVMYVADDRIDEYKAAGHKLAVDSFTERKTVETKPPAKPKRRRTTKK